MSLPVLVTQIADRSVDASYIVTMMAFFAVVSVCRNRLLADFFVHRVSSTFGLLGHTQRH